MDVGCKVSESCFSFDNIHEAIAAVEEYQEKETASFSVFKVEKNFGNSGRLSTSFRIWPKGLSPYLIGLAEPDWYWL